MKKMSLETKWGTVFYWISDPWDKNRETIFFLHGLTHPPTDSQDPLKNLHMRPLLFAQKRYLTFAACHRQFSWDSPWGDLFPNR